jgi:predicted CXXCH cytochrome family protein
MGLGQDAEEDNLPRAHTGLACTECHDFSGQATAGAAPSDRSCRSCHALQNAVRTGAGHAFHSDPSRGCLECHSFHEVRSIKIRDQRFSIEFDNAALQAICRSCHLAGMGTPKPENGHEAAVDFFHSGDPALMNLSPSEACLICHDSDSFQEPPAFSACGAPRFRTRASHPFGVTVTPGQGEGAMPIRLDIDPRILLIDQRIECQTCHLAAGAGEDKLVELDGQLGLCLGCHQKVGGSRITLMASAPDRGAEALQIISASPS